MQLPGNIISKLHVLLSYYNRCRKTDVIGFICMRNKSESWKYSWDLMRVEVQKWNCTAPQVRTMRVYQKMFPSVHVFLHIARKTKFGGHELSLSLQRGDVMLQANKEGHELWSLSNPPTSPLAFKQRIRPKRFWLQGYLSPAKQKHKNYAARQCRQNRWYCQNSLQWNI